MGRLADNDSFPLIIAGLEKTLRLLQAGAQIMVAWMAGTGEDAVSWVQARKQFALGDFSDFLGF